MTFKKNEIAKKVEWYVNNANYSDDHNYMPSDFALEFVSFIKLVNGAEGEENKTPVLHYRMLDKIAGKEKNIINMLFRGAAKTTLLGEYLFLYLGVFVAHDIFRMVERAVPPAACNKSR